MIVSTRFRSYEWCNTSHKKLNIFLNTDTVHMLNVSWYELDFILQSGPCNPILSTMTGSRSPWSQAKFFPNVYAWVCFSWERLGTDMPAHDSSLPSSSRGVSLKQLNIDWKEHGPLHSCMGTLIHPSSHSHFCQLPAANPTTSSTFALSPASLAAMTSNRHCQCDSRPTTQDTDTQHSGILECCWLSMSLWPRHIGNDGLWSLLPGWLVLAEMAHSGHRHGGSSTVLICKD